METGSFSSNGARLWQKAGFRHFLLVSPAMVALLLLFAYPISRILMKSLFDPHFTLKHYAYFFSSPLYIRVMWITIELSLLTTFTALVIGYILAYVLRRARPGIRNIFLLAIVLSFMISLLVRNYSWILVLQRNGVIN
ncbi:MAG: hypothetical protein DRN37_08810, partial [Thermoplasmata archaeon]